MIQTVKKPLSFFKKSARTGSDFLRFTPFKVDVQLLARIMFSAFYETELTVELEMFFMFHSGVKFESEIFDCLAF